VYTVSLGGSDTRMAETGFGNEPPTRRARRAGRLDNESHRPRPGTTLMAIGFRPGNGLPAHEGSDLDSATYGACFPALSNALASPFELLREPS